MGYTPKSKYQILQSSGDKYIDPRTNNPYVGPYILTSGGAIIGNNLKTKNPIQLINDNQSNINNNLFITEESIEYYPLNKKTSNFLKNTFPIVSTKIKPTKKDYERGYYTRYFCKRNNSESVYYEISKITYNALIAKSNAYDYNLYTAGSLIWAIDGNILKANNTTLILQSKKFPNINALFAKINEFQKVRTAEKGELTYLNGEEYMGYYHIHNNQPMEGLYHEQKSHKKLLFSISKKSLLYKKDSNIKQTYQPEGSFNTSYNKMTPSIYSPSQETQEQITQIVSPSSPPPNLSSGGGGGGY